MNSFTETQRFRQWWLWAILAATLIVPLGMVWRDIFMQHESHSFNEIISGAVVPVAIMVLFWSFKLDTQIDHSGISYRFFPVQFSMKKIEWSEVNKVYIRQYSPLAEYGGWGIRFGFKGTGTAYNIAGNIGLQLELKKKGKKILFGTQDRDQMQQVLNQLSKEKVITADMLKP